jgi:hypothetical protein
VENFKSGQALGFDPFNIERRDLGCGRTFSAPADKLFEDFFFPFSMDFYSAIGAVFCPPTQAQLQSLLARAGSKPDPLHTAARNKMDTHQHGLFSTRSLVFAKRVIKKMLDFPADLKLAPVSDFFSELAEVAHDALELLSLSLELFNERTKIELLVLIQSITDNPEPGF